MRDAGIPEKFTTNSIRHSLISDLFKHGWTEAQVNAFTGHSPRFHTALKFYNHLDANWLGAEIAKLGQETGPESDMHVEAMAMMSSDIEVAAQEEDDGIE
jgi:hypothetical protein